MAPSGPQVAFLLPAILLCQEIFLERPLLPVPHIVFILVDDLGWAEVGFNRASGSDKDHEVQTPNIDELVHQGVRLDRHYVHMFCSPTRAAIQSGRAPIHVNVLLTKPNSYNAADPEGGFAGIPRSMTGIAEVLRTKGYRTHYVGKWDAGMATPDHTPAGRGYETTLAYFHHTNGCWDFKASACGGTGIYDMWNMLDDVEFPGAPAVSYLNGQSCSFSQQTSANETCTYEDELFENRVKLVIDRHDVSEPLFLFWATRTAHAALQPPDEVLAKFAAIDVKGRQHYHAMVNWIDGSIGRVVDRLSTKGLYENTLLVFSSDNGGNLPNGNNFPLKGGKSSNWEGGIRAAAFVSGGFVPKVVRGTASVGLVAAWDWYGTFAALAGANPSDSRAARAGLPPVDSINIWPFIAGETTESPRQHLEIGSNVGGSTAKYTGATTLGGLIVPPYKIVFGDDLGQLMRQATWTGPVSPNSSAPAVDYEAFTQVCGRTAATGCLYDIFTDPSEQHNLANEHSDEFVRLMQEVEILEQSLYSPDRGKTSKEACRVAEDNHNFWGPFLP